MTELQKNTKRNIISVLEHLSSRILQIDYKKSVPFVNLPNELLAQWESHNDKKNLIWYKEIWTNNEYQALNEFGDKLDVLMKELKQINNDVPEIFECEYWLKIMNDAKKCLNRID